MKVASWNVENALRCLPALPEIVRELGTPDVVCLQEIRIRPQDADAIRALEGAVPGYRCHHALARDPRNVVYFDEEGCVAGDRHALKRRFQSDVLDLGRELRRNGGVIMAGDWNVSCTAQDTHPRLRSEQPHALARAELNARLTSEGFVDIWRERHPRKSCRSCRGAITHR